MQEICTFVWAKICPDATSPNTNAEIDDRGVGVGVLTGVTAGLGVGVGELPGCDVSGETSGDVAGDVLGEAVGSWLGGGAARAGAQPVRAEMAAIKSQALGARLRLDPVRPKPVLAMRFRPVRKGDHNQPRGSPVKQIDVRGWSA